MKSNFVFEKDLPYIFPIFGAWNIETNIVVVVLNHPYFSKYLQVKVDHFPNFRTEHIKPNWHHHLETEWNNRL